MTVTDIQEHARKLNDDLELLRFEIETVSISPLVKSALSREICESQARVSRVIQECTRAGAVPLVA